MQNKFRRNRRPVTENEAITYDEIEKMTTIGAAFVCECLKCKHVMNSDRHCRFISCPKCGGQMRRKNRPGIGR